MTEPTYPLTPRPLPELPATLRAAAEAALDYSNAAQAVNTRRAYKADWHIFSAWCSGYGLSALPAQPATLQAFLADQARAGIAVVTLRRRLAAIRAAHLAAGQALPPTDHADVRRTLAGIARLHPRRPNKKAPLLPEVLGQLLLVLPDGPEGLRDRALLLLGFGGAFRRVELAAIAIEHLTFVPEGMLVYLPSSKTDRESRGQEVPIARGERHCPVAAVKAWLEWLGCTQGPLFPSFVRVRRTGELRIRPRAMTDREVPRRIQRYARRAGLPVDVVAKLAGHSLRAGFVTAALRNGADVFKVMDVTRHVSVETVREYNRDPQRFRGHAGEGLL